MFMSVGAAAEGFSSYEDQIDRAAIPCPPVIRLIAQTGDISEDEAFTVWNMGLGYVFVVSAHAIQAVLKTLPEAFVCGQIVRTMA